MSRMSDRFAKAFGAVLGEELDRRILIQLHEAGREVRYEELRKAVGEPSSQTFKYAFDRLMRHALLDRRLEERGERYHSHLSPTARGRMIAQILVSLGKRGELPSEIPAEYRDGIQKVFLGAALKATG